MRKAKFREVSSPFNNFKRLAADYGKMPSMSALVQQHLFRYPFRTQLLEQPSSKQLRPATFSANTDVHRYFFHGGMRNPRRTLALQRSLMQIVQARFHVPAAMRQRILAQADPVVSSNEEWLRFEGFSGGGGVYVRLDLRPGAIGGDTMERGTTNADFNHPVRWLRGFVEVQAVQQRMQLTYELNSLQALRFLRSLPRMKTNRHATWLTKAGDGLKPVTRPSDDPRKRCKRGCLRNPAERSLSTTRWQGPNLTMDGYERAVQTKPVIAS